jgi:hypothetical protein
MTNLIYTPPSERRTFFDKVFDVLEMVFGRFFSLRWTLEQFCVVYPIEGAMRLWYHLDPRVYSERLRLRGVTDGRCAKKSDRYVLFVLYTRHKVPAFTQPLIDAVGRSKLNLVISTNAQISPELRETLLNQCHLLIERADLGRDFGGYKDGISIIEQRFGAPERIILLNDSLFYFERQGGLDRFLRGLDGEDALISMTEVFEIHYHLGSFAISFGRPVLENKRFRRYWQKYRPISTRRWSIHKGEVGLTKMLIKAGFPPHVLYHGAQLIPFLSQQKAREFLESVRFLPTDFRKRLYSEFEDVHATQTDRPLQAIGTLSKSIRRIDANKEALHEELRTANVRQMLEINRLTATTQLDRESWVLKSLGHRIVSSIVRRNQMHTGGFLFMKYLGMPAIKRDIIYREVFRLAEVEDILEQLNEPLKEEVSADLRQKGSQSYLFGLPKLLARHGSI